MPGFFLLFLRQVGQFYIGGRVGDNLELLFDNGVDFADKLALFFRRFAVTVTCGVANKFCGSHFFRGNHGQICAVLIAFTGVYRYDDAAFAEAVQNLGDDPFGESENGGDISGAWWFLFFDIFSGDDSGDSDGVAVFKFAAEPGASGHNVDIVDILGEERDLGAEEYDQP